MILSATAKADLPACKSIRAVLPRPYEQKPFSSVFGLFPVLHAEVISEGYYKALQDVTEYADWTNWILYILDAVEVTAKKTLSMIQEIRKVQLETETFVKNEMADIYSRELIELLFEQPYCKISFLVDRHIAKKQTASKYLNRLVTARLLDKTKQGREYYFINKNLWEILTR